ncbi:hypothetical protein C942_04348 [Photobacterium marinum]|uniref:Uncharacterized protein n=1 Tax=Photobacterium marinum TaxID=1056511 RepID=L8JCT7_9GAMM|nr:hypothetical protein C942_04348 [Photobacterium marinum]
MININHRAKGIQQSDWQCVNKYTVNNKHHAAAEIKIPEPFHIGHQQ